MHHFTNWLMSEPTLHSPSTTSWHSSPQSRLLKTFTFNPSNSHQKWHPTSAPLHFFCNTFRDLTIQSRSIWTFSLFSSLTYPSLQSLGTFHYSVTDQTSRNLSELTQLLQRSNCQLQDLEIVNAYLSEDDLELLLSSSTLHSLTYLLLSVNLVSDGLIRLLMEKSEMCSHRFLPRLEILYLTPWKTMDGLLASMISSRRHDIENSPGTLWWVHVSPKFAFGFIDDNFFKIHANNLTFWIFDPCILLLLQYRESYCVNKNSVWNDAFHILFIVFATCW